MGTTIITAAVAALVAFVFSILHDLISSRRAFAERWDKDLFELSGSVLSAARRVWHLAAAKGALDEAALDVAHGELRMNCSRLLVLASENLATAALGVQRAAYAVISEARGQGDPRPDDHTPAARLVSAMDDFNRELRSQLRLAPISRTRLDD